MSQQTPDLYNGGHFTVLDYTYGDGLVQQTADTIACPTVLAQLSNEQLDQTLAEVNRSWRVVEQSGVSVEMVEAGADRKESVLQIGSYSASFIGIPGNSYEVAVQAGQHPERHLVAFAAPANGGTSALTKAEQRYLAKTGRLTYEDGDRVRALPSLQKMGQIARSEGLTIDAYTGDSFGGRLGIAMALEQPRGEVTSVFASSTPNLSDHRVLAGAPVEIIAQMLGKQLVYYEARDKRESGDIWRVTPQRVAETKNALPAIYTQLHPDLTQRSLMQQAARLAALGRTAAGLSRGPRQGDPLAREVMALLAWHGDAEINIVAGTADPLHSGVVLDTRFRQLVQKVADSSAQSASRLRCTALPGMAHGYKTYYPALYYGLQERLMTA